MGVRRFLLRFFSGVVWLLNLVDGEDSSHYDYNANT